MRRPAFWYSGVFLGVILVIVGLIVDAWRHSVGSAAEESLLSLGNPGHLIAAIGLGLAALSALIGLTLGWWEWTGWPQPDASDLFRRLAVPAVAWVGLGGLSVGAAAYIGSADVVIGHGSHEEGAAVAGIENGTAVVSGSEHEGDERVSPTDPAASVTEIDTHAEHDVGPHPTFDQFMSMGDEDLVSRVPTGTMQAADVSLLREQLRQVRGAADRYGDVNAALADGYYNTTHDVPFMGAHFINGQYLSDGLFEPSKPEGLLYSKLGSPDGPWQLVGVWFLQLPGSGGATMDKEPDGFAGNLDYWHGHQGLCTAGSGLQIRENATAEECAAEGGSYIADLRWMAHVWALPEVAQNDDGVFAYLNENLFKMQVRVGSPEAGTASN